MYPKTIFYSYSLTGKKTKGVDSLDHKKHMTECDSYLVGVSILPSQSSAIMTRIILTWGWGPAGIVVTEVKNITVVSDLNYLT